MPITRVNHYIMSNNKSDYSHAYPMVIAFFSCHAGYRKTTNWVTVSVVVVRSWATGWSGDRWPTSFASKHNNKSDLKRQNKYVSCFLVLQNKYEYVSYKWTLPWFQKIFYTIVDMNQETSFIQYTSMKMWRKCCQNYQKRLQFMSHWRGMKFDGYKFWVGYNNCSNKQ